MNRLFRHKIALVLISGILLGTGLYVFGAHIWKEKVAKQVSSNTQPTSFISNETLPLQARVISPQGVHILVRAADTDDTRELGLSYFESLPDGQGMLFIFPQVGTYSFWMKDMNFPLDIVWIDQNFKIIDRVINVSPVSYPKTFTPSGSVSYAIELPANTADRDGFIVGKHVVIQNDK